MGGAASFKPFPRFFFFFTVILIAEAAGDTTRETLPSSKLPSDEIGTGEPPPPPLPPPPGNSYGGGRRGSSLKPTVIIVVGVLAALFSLTFLLVLYARHCRPENVPPTNSSGGAASSGRRSGIDRTVIESLPIFRFGSLKGQKDGLECAVCLNRFECMEVLRLLPKCKHAFHVECVDTWLDAHSTCPLCRSRVDPEDILLVEEAKAGTFHTPIPPIQENTDDPEQQRDIETGPEQGSLSRVDSNSILRRVSGRHSSVGETGVVGGGGGGGSITAAFLQLIMQQRTSVEGETPTSQKKMAALRKSVDSAISTKRKRNEAVKEGGSDGPRKDALLLAEKENKHRLEHRIIVSPSPKANALHQRWSDVQPSDLLYLTSEMILRDHSHRLSSSSPGPSLPRPSRHQQQHRNEASDNRNRTGDNRRGGGAINLRSVSEITGLSRNRREEGQHHHRDEEEERQAGVASRWRAWISQAQRSVR